MTESNVRILIVRSIIAVIVMFILGCGAYLIVNGHPWWAALFIFLGYSSSIGASASK